MCPTVTTAVSLVWVPGKRLISLLGHRLIRLRTTGLNTIRAGGGLYRLLYVSTLRSSITKSSLGLLHYKENSNYPLLDVSLQAVQ